MHKTQVSFCLRTVLGRLSVARLIFASALSFQRKCLSEKETLAVDAGRGRNV